MDNKRATGDPTTNRVLAKLEGWDRKYIGSPCHFIGAQDCLFHLATMIGPYVVSTVGDYHPIGTPDVRGTGERHPVGYNRFYETMVFRHKGMCNCGCARPDIIHMEIDFKAYDDAPSANAGHEEMCQKYEALLEKGLSDAS